MKQNKDSDNQFADKAGTKAKAKKLDQILGSIAQKRTKKEAQSGAGQPLDEEDSELMA